MSLLAERPDIQAAQAWLTENIRTTTDGAKLEEMLRLVYLIHEDGTGARYSAYHNAIRHYLGGHPYTPTVAAALDRIRESYGRLWNYTGD